jgi:predicted DNA-binding protein
MPTIKKRLNISLSLDLENILKMSAKRDGVPQATKAAELLMLALEIEEDAKFGILVKDRINTKKSEFVSHEQTWKNI